MADLIDSQETVTQNVDVRELTEGLDVQTYYLAQTKDSAGTNTILTKNLIYSNNKILNHDGDGTHTDNFDSDTFQRPRVLDGTIHFTLWSAHQKNDSSPTLTLTIKLYHYDGSTATQLGSTWTSDTISVGPTQVNQMFNGFVTLASPQKFKKGDLLRLEIETVNFHTNVKFGTDPQNRSKTTFFDTTNEDISTQFIVRVPFKAIR